MNLPTSRLAARTGVSQVEALLKADRAAEAAERAVHRVWRRLLALLATEPTPWDAWRGARVILAGLHAETHGTVMHGLRGLGRFGHKEAAKSLSRTVPLPLLRYAARRARTRVPRPYLEAGPGALGFSSAPPHFDDDTQPLREPAYDSLSADEQRERFEELLFAPPPESELDRIVRATTGGVSWEQRLQAATSLAGPEQLAGLLLSSMAGGKSQREVMQDILPHVDNVRTTARRIARTEGMRVANAMHFEASEQLGPDVVPGYQIHATLDQNTRPAHAARNGTIYWREPKAGQKGFDEMPSPPQEADGSTAHNCRCFMTALLTPPEGLFDDKAAVAEFRTATDKTIPDPAVYSEWFDQADEPRRRLAVGTRRYSAVADKLGKEPGWEHFVTPDGDLVPLGRLKAETAKQREKRADAVRAVMAERRELVREVGARGFLLPEEPAREPRRAKAEPPSPSRSSRPRPEPTPPVHANPYQAAASGEAPWTGDLLRAVAAGGRPLTLPELYAQLKARNPGLTPGQFHDALRALEAKGQLSLAPFAGGLQNLTEPRLALYSGQEVKYYASPTAATKPPPTTATPAPAAVPATAWHEQIVTMVQAQHAENAFRRLTIPQIYERLKASNPGLTLGQMQDALRALSDQGKVRLWPYTQGLINLPDPKAAIYLDQEVKYYVDVR